MTEYIYRISKIIRELEAYKKWIAARKTRKESWKDI